MSKKDRIAIAASVVFFVAAVGATIQFLYPASVALLIYWGVRFAKGNISFIGKNKSEVAD